MTRDRIIREHSPRKSDFTRDEHCFELCFIKFQD